MEALVQNSLFVMMGISFYAFLHHVLIGYKPVDKGQLIFAGTCLVVAIFEYTLLLNYRASNFADMIFSIKILLSLALLIAILLPWFVMVICNQKRTWLSVGIYIIAALLLVTNLLQPYSLQFSEILQIKTVALPWGESIYIPSGRLSRWFFFGAIFFLVAILYCMVELYRAYRKSKEGPYLGLFITIVIFFIFAIEGILVRLQIIEFIYMGPFGFFFMIIIMSAIISRDARTKTLASEQRFKFLVEQSPLSKILVSPQGNIIEVNHAFEQMWGINKEDIRNYPILEDKQLLDQQIVQYISQGLSGVTTHTPPYLYNAGKVPGLQGTDRELNIQALVYPVKDIDGKVMEVILVQENITDRLQAESERQKLQSQLQQSQKMESIGHLTGGIAHDFNNMLGTMLGYTDLIKQMSGNNKLSQNQMDKYLDEILTAGDRAKNLISQMLVYSRLHPDLGDKETPVTFLAPIIKEVVSLLRSSIPCTIEVNCVLDDENLKTHIEPVQLHQILMNIILNARDAIGEYGHIEISLTECKIKDTCNSCHADFAGNYIAICVSDNGHGISRHVQNKIFDPFFTTKDVGKGTGMGMSVVHGIIHGVGGHITLSSRVNAGTSVCVYLPQITSDLEKGKEKEEEIMNSLHNSLTGIHIMLIDDEEAMVAWLHELLTVYGAIVEKYTDSNSALKAFIRSPDNIDLVITDETMPGLSGFDMAKKMLNIRSDIPIILCTGYSEYVNAETAQQNGIAGFMYKPIDTRYLISLVKQLVSKGS